MKEIWKPVKMEGVEDGYAISNHGRVFDLKLGNYKNFNDNGFGYKTYGLRKANESGGVTKYVHRLVGKFFLENTDNLPQIGHKDHDRSNNHYTNLYWTTPSQNTRDGVEAGRINAKKRPNTKQLSKENICEIALLSTQGYGVAEIGRKLGFARTTISSVFNGRSNWELFKFTLDEIENNS